MTVRPHVGNAKVVEVSSDEGQLNGCTIGSNLESFNKRDTINGLNIITTDMMA